MDVQSATASSQQTQTTANKSTPSSDYETFLQMLTVQMTNQDPLNPVDSSDYAVQLATFSSVEQQVLTNELLSGLTAQLSASGLSDLGAWVGRDVRSAAPVQFDGTPMNITTPIASGATRAELEVLDKAGKVVQTVPLELTQERIDWTGAAPDSSTLANGQYSFQVRSFIGEDDIGAKPAGTYSRIQEAQISDGATILILENGSKISPNDVTAIRN